MRGNGPLPTSTFMFYSWHLGRPIRDPSWRLLPFARRTSAHFILRPLGSLRRIHDVSELHVPWDCVPGVQFHATSHPYFSLRFTGSRPCTQRCLAITTSSSPHVLTGRPTMYH